MCVFGVSTARNSLGHLVESNILVRISIDTWNKLDATFLMVIVLNHVFLFASFLYDKQLDVNIVLRTKTDKEA